MRKICVFTGSRAEYGLLRPLLLEIKKDSILQIIASGTHVSPEFDMTYREIENDGFPIDEKIEMLLSSDTHVGMSKSIDIGILSCGEAIERLKPDMVVILGDRFETLAFTVSAAISKIPIAHIHGGEITEGALDDSFRHAISKLSHLHFTATEEYRKRVIQMGEHPQRVFNVGALGIENIQSLELLSKEELEGEWNFKFRKRNLLITFHPATLEEESTGMQFQNLLEALDELEETALIFTKANADAGGRLINAMIDDYVARRSQGCISFVSMGQLRYLSVMQLVDAVAGNSSSGIIEAPSFKIGTINIGDRQKGRIKAESIIDCAPSKTSIGMALEKLYSGGFRETLKKVKNPYGEGGTASKIAGIIKDFDVKGIVKKTFYDISN